MNDRNYPAVGEEWESKGCDPLNDIKKAMEGHPIPRQNTFFLPKSLVDHFKTLGYVPDDCIEIITANNL